MPTKETLKFRPERAIRYFMKSEFELNIASVFDFYKGGLKNMVAWKKHFRGLGVPFAVTAESARDINGSVRYFWILWKRRIV